MNWYEEKYIQRRDWILDQFEFLNLSLEEGMIVLLIDFLNQNQVPITLDLLSKKTSLKQEKLEEIINVLCSKNVLLIQASIDKVNFKLDGLFSVNTKRPRDILDQSLFEIFQMEFKRPLTKMEMEKISDWNRQYERKMIIQALRKSSAQQKITIVNIDRNLEKLASQKMSEGV